MKHCDKRVVTVNVTNKCNLRCEYCMASSSEEQEHPLFIDEGFAFRGIADALQGAPTGIKASGLRFFSPGEPTQAMNTMANCVNYARTLKPDITLELQTNGLFCSEKDTKWIADNFDYVWFSLDGPKCVNDRHRPDEFGRGRTDEIENNLKIVMKSGHAVVGVRSTVVEELLPNQEEIVRHYYDLGVKHLCLNPIIRQIKRGETEIREVTKNDIMIFAEGFVRAFNLGKELGMYINSSLTFNFDEPTCIACRSLLPVPQLNPDGSVSSCDMALYSDTEPSLQPFLYGHWNPKTQRIVYDLAKIKALQSRKLGNLPVCDSCEIKDNCAGGCAGRVAFETGSIFKVIPAYCAATKFLAKHLPLNSRTPGLPTHP